MKVPLVSIRRQEALSRADFPYSNAEAPDLYILLPVQGLTTYAHNRMHSDTEA